MDYFQVRKNNREVIRIFRGPYEGHDITRLQIWYKDRDTDEYRPGRTVAFNSNLIQGVVEGLREMASMEPIVPMPDAVAATELKADIHEVLLSHGQPLHADVVFKILESEHPDLRASEWAVYNTLLSNSELFMMREDDVFEAHD